MLGSEESIVVMVQPVKIIVLIFFLLVNRNTQQQTRATEHILPIYNIHLFFLKYR
jgi:hypothetical protein